MRNYLFKQFIYCIFLLFCTSVISAESKLIKGEYITKDGLGVLKLKERNNKTEFSIYALGTNGHTCEVEGVINNGQALLEQGCIVDFKQKNTIISVAPSQECHYSCGMRAWFEGDYLTPPKGCFIKEQQTRNQLFKKLYQKHQYQSALKQAQTLLDDCQSFMDQFGQDFLKNDIAITQHHLGDNRGCRSTLKMIDVDVNQSEDDLRGTFPPMEADIVIGIAKAKRTNLKLCSNN